MICETIKKDEECIFMTAKGCSYNDGFCREIVEQCKTCNHSIELQSGWYCNACPEPSLKWKNGNCNLASHITATSKKEKTKINPLKASKRGQR